MREDLLQLRRIIRIIPMFPGMKFHADHVPLPQIQINFLMDIGRLGIDERITPNLFWIQLHGFIDKVVLATIIGTGQTADTGLRDAMAEHVLYELMNVMRLSPDENERRAFSNGSPLLSSSKLRILLYLYTNMSYKNVNYEYMI